MGWFWTLQCVLAAFFYLSSMGQIFEEDDEEILMLKNIIDRQDRIFNYFEDLHNKVEGLEAIAEAQRRTAVSQHNNQIATRNSLQELQNKMDAIQDNHNSMAHMQTTMTESQKTLEESGQRQEEILQIIKTYIDSQPVVKLASMLGKDECQIGSHNCSSHAICMDMMIGYHCQCLQGYTGDGHFCNDIDECEAQPCHINASCTNTEGNYTCNCIEPFKGDGVTCEEPCQSPSTPISGLGCITPIYEKESWDDHKKLCEDMGMQLIEGFDKEQLQLIRDAFGEGMFDISGVPWIGVRGRKWTYSNESVPQDLWWSEEPDGGEDDCAFLRARKRGEYGLVEHRCSSTGRTLCQAFY